MLLPPIYHMVATRDCTDCDDDLARTLGRPWQGRGGDCRWVRFGATSSLERYGQKSSSRNCHMCVGSGISWVLGGEEWVWEGRWNWAALSFTKFAGSLCWVAVSFANETRSETGRRDALIPSSISIRVANKSSYYQATNWPTECPRSTLLSRC